ncbi:MAG: signal peptidase II, partial [Peptococcaceae bacterium]|nr:signal peptidase II [Peptococcaceae bacterium]
MFILFLDQVSKMIIISRMYLGQSTPVIKDIFHITYIHNPGAAF